jgi:hypothetical protein
MRVWNCSMAGDVDRNLFLGHRRPVFRVLAEPKSKRLMTVDIEVEGTVEPARHAAARAAAEALGVPVQVQALRTALPVMKVSDRDYSVRHYAYHVFREEAHPEFANRPWIQQPHIWLAAHAAVSGALGVGLHLRD